MILAGIVIALVLTSWFLLPSLMPGQEPGNGLRDLARDGGARPEITPPTSPSDAGLPQRQQPQQSQAAPSYT
jgi:hypothetical protein